VPVPFPAVRWLLRLHVDALGAEALPYDDRAGGRVHRTPALYVRAFA
jgi:hypothetical protein